MSEGNTLKREGPRREISTPVERLRTRPRRVLEPEASIPVSKADRGAGRAKMFADAKARLKTMNASDARFYLSRLPVALLEVHLLAEESQQNREAVLKTFPKPGQRAREWFFPESLSPMGALESARAASSNTE